MGRTDPAGGDHVVERRPALVHRVDDLPPVVGDDTDLAQPDAERFQALGEIVDVLVLGAAGKDLVADNHDAGGDDSLFGHCYSGAARPGGILRGRRKPNHPRPSRRTGWTVRLRGPYKRAHDRPLGKHRARAARTCSTGRTRSPPCGGRAGWRPRCSTSSPPMWRRASPPARWMTLCHEFIVERGAVPAPLNYPWLPEVDLHLGQPCRLPRHPGRQGAQGRRHREHRHHGDPRWLARRYQPHVPGRPGGREGAPPDRRDIRIADARDRGRAPWGDAGRYRPRDPEPCRGRALLGGARFSAATASGGSSIARRASSTTAARGKG